MKLNDKKVINGWAIYDWANSVYFLVISTAIFPAYFIAITDDNIDILGSSVSNSSLYAYSVAFSYIIMVILAPVLSGISDYGGKRMVFLKFFTYLGSISCMLLVFFDSSSSLWLGVLGFVFATIGAAGGLVFYNAYLPEIVTEDRYDEVSAKGYAFGYVGSVILLLIILFTSVKPELFGIAPDSNFPFRFGFVLVGLWWMGFSQITFRRLPKSKSGSITVDMIKKGNAEILFVFKKLRTNANLKKFLLAVLFYSAGVQTVIYLASVFAKEELAFDTNELIIIILILQLVAIFGAYIFAIISNKQGNKRALIYMVIIWTSITIIAYFVTSKIQFYILAGFVGLVMGGIQSLSRSSYSKLVNEHKDELTSYFSFYDIVIKISIILGTFSFGAVNQIMGGLRPSVLSLAVFFVLGLFFLYQVNFNPKK
jgi:UMF1 family MFS transporter